MSTSTNTVLFVLLPEYADWEPALLAAGLQGGFGMWEPRFTVKTVAPGGGEVASIGGFRVRADYDFHSAPRDFAGLVLVGGMSWFRPGAEAVLPLVRRAVESGAVLAGICDGSMFLGVHGFLNDVQHTSNSLAHLQERAGAAYSGAERYHADRSSVRDGRVVTANGVGFVEFARDVLAALDAAPAERLAVFYDTVKSGFFPANL